MQFGQIEYNFNEDDKILYVQFTGDITVDNLIDYITIVGSNMTYPRVLKILEDRRNGIFNFSIRENIRISKHAYQFAKNYKKVYMAAVNDKPKETAFTIDYEILISKLSKKEKVKAFATFEAAQRWLLSI